MAEQFSEILQDLPKFRDTAFGLREVMLSNLVLVGEIPSPTFG